MDNIDRDADSDIDGASPPLDDYDFHAFQSPPLDEPPVQATDSGSGISEGSRSEDDASVRRDQSQSPGPSTTSYDLPEPRLEGLKLP